MLAPAAQEEYELEDGTALVSPCAAKHWRQKHEVHRVGAFHQLHVRYPSLQYALRAGWQE